MEIQWKIVPLYKKQIFLQKKNNLKNNRLLRLSYERQLKRIHRTLNIKRRFKCGAYLVPVEANGGTDCLLRWYKPMDASDQKHKNI